MQAVDPDGLRGTCNKDNGTRMRDGDVAVKCLSIKSEYKKHRNLLKEKGSTGCNGAPGWGIGV